MVKRALSMSNLPACWIAHFVGRKLNAARMNTLSMLVALIFTASQMNFQRGVLRKSGTQDHNPTLNMRIRAMDDKKKTGRCHDSLNVMVGHCCHMCGVVLQPKRTQSGKYKGSVYYTKLCEDCLIKHRVAFAGKNANYDKSRKHWCRTCAVCGCMFDVRGKANSGKVKTCSRNCENALHRANAIEKNLAERYLAPNREKGFIKKFEAPQTKDSVRLGPKHWASMRVVLIDPHGCSHNIINVVDFVRNNERLFNVVDVEWVPARRRSLVRDAGFRPSLATGCLRCHASTGLQAVSSGRRKSWKGWIKANEKNEGLTAPKEK